MRCCSRSEHIQWRDSSNAILSKIYISDIEFQLQELSSFLDHLYESPKLLCKIIKKIFCRIRFINDFPINKNIKAVHIWSMRSESYDICYRGINHKTVRTCKTTFVFKTWLYLYGLNVDTSSANKKSCADKFKSLRSFK